MRGGPFRKLSKLLEQGGWNYWDARMEARKILDIKGPHDYSLGRPKSKYDYDGVLSPDMIPTDEEKLEIDFWAVVSDLRAVLSGQLVPRPWAELSATWTEGPINRIQLRKIPDVESGLVSLRKQISHAARSKKYAAQRMHITSEERKIRKILRYTKKYSEVEVIQMARTMCSAE